MAPRAAGASWAIKTLHWGELESVRYPWLRPRILSLAAIFITIVPGTLSAQSADLDPAVPARRRIIVGLPVAQMGPPQSGLIVEPNVQIIGEAPTSEPDASSGISAIGVSGPTSAPLGGGADAETLATPVDQLPPNTTGELFGPGFDGQIIGEPVEPGIGDGPPPGAGASGPCFGCGRLRRRGRAGLFSRDPTADIGVGQERVGLAPSELDIAQPFSNLRVRTNAVYNEPDPTRAEYLWSAPATLGGKGPAKPEQTVNYQDIRFYLEQALAANFSTFVEVPVRFLDPVVNANGAGLADMNAGMKLMLINGKCWQITGQLRTYIPTGAVARGLGDGHATLEPGLLARYHWSDETYFHFNLKFWTPLGGTPGVQGMIVNYGAGISTLFYDSDTWAVIPTMEWVMWSVMSGEQAVFPTGLAQSVDSLTILNVIPGVRWVRDCGCQDLGLFEGYLGAGIPITNNRWYDAMLRAEMRWSY